MTDTIRWCFTHDHRYDGDTSCAAFVGECDTSCEVETLMSRAEWEATIDWEMMASALFEWAVDEMENVSLPDGTHLADLFSAALGVGEETP